MTPKAQALSNNRSSGRARRPAEPQEDAKSEKLKTELPFVNLVAFCSKKPGSTGGEADYD